MITSEWQINLREANLPLLEALVLRVPAAPKAFLRQLCKKQRVAVNRLASAADHPVRYGATITVIAGQRWQDCLEQSRLQPDEILYEDGQCMVLNKPAGLAIHRAHGHDDNLLLRVEEFLRLRGETFMVAPVQRLDIGTSGAVLFGKGRATISRLGQDIMAGRVSKRYLALIGEPVRHPGELRTPVPAKGRIKEALTRFRPVAAVGSHTLLELELVTGRRHQIRHQLASAGWPIIGDTRYGGKTVSDMKRPFLHCHHLAFLQPATGKAIDIGCPLSRNLSGYLDNLGMTYEIVADMGDKYLPND